MGKKTKHPSRESIYVLIKKSFTVRGFCPNIVYKNVCSPMKADIFHIFGFQYKFTCGLSAKFFVRFPLLMSLDKVCH